ncbi:amidohydrolase family protein [Phytohabitans kaempferiae]|uniref:Amidohydrolase family protein n=1 Tax=Phytohabitans kaempferiae TaxID=1620943 RepID=A0ABV6MAE3_9ACTN
MYDVLVTGGELLDPATGARERRAVAVLDGAVASLDADPAAPSRRVLDVSGALVLPGLVDLHTHVYGGASPLGFDPWRYSFRDGVTTVVDAGTAGAYTFDGLKRTSQALRPGHVFAFVNLATIGVTHNEAGELRDLAYVDRDALVDVITANPDLVVGIKLRMSNWVVDNDPEVARRALALALEVGTATGCRLMVHISDPPIPIADILGALRAGDVVTHVFSGSGETILSSEQTWAATVAARERGVLFDIGCGRGGLDFDVARTAMARGFLPDTISSDLTAVTADGPVFGLTNVMSKLLALGMPLERVIQAVTVNPAAILGRPELGRLREGGEADIAVLGLERGHFVFQNLRFIEKTVQEMVGDQHLRALVTLVGGEPLVGSAALRVAGAGEPA